MRPEKLEVFVNNVIDKIPKKIQNIVFKTITELRFVVFRIRLVSFIRPHTVPSPTRIYWISPERIVYHTNYHKEADGNAVPFWDRVFEPNMRGKVVDGNWDQTNYRFTDLSTYKAFWQRIKEGAEWQDTDFYKEVQRSVKSGQFPYGLSSERDIENRFSYLDALIKNIKTEGYRMSRAIRDKNFTYDEIEVNIGRDGEYLFQNGAHRLSIAKILGTERVPVMVFVRHKKWQEFRDFVYAYTQNSVHLKKGVLYQPIVHPDLSDIPYDFNSHDCYELVEAIRRHLGKKGGTVLDLGANIGFFCHKFEDLGYRCIAVENDPATAQILEKIKIAENKKFEVINKSILELEFSRNIKFDVVLALNIFHHFLKRKADFVRFKKFLNNLETDELFFEPHFYREEQMKNAYTDFTPTQFVDFILQNTSLTKFEIIYNSKGGRHVFKLWK